MQKLNSFKRGDTFSFFIIMKDGNGAPMTGKEADLKSQVRTVDDTFICELAISETLITPGEYFLITETSTQDWPLGNLVCDIQLTSNGIVTSSETFAIPVVKDVSR